MRILLSRIFTLLMVTACATQNQKPEFAQISGNDHFGKSVSIDTSKTLATVIVFLSAKCPCSDSNSHVIADLVKKYPKFTFIGVHSNVDEDVKTAQKYFSAKKFQFPIIHDKDSEIALKLGALKTPHVFIISSKGNVIYNGSVTNSTNASMASEFYLDGALTEIKSGKLPTAPRKKTLGCYIKLKS